MLVAIAATGPATALGGNAVEIESKWVEANATGVELGIYLDNSDRLSCVLLPLEIRTVHVGSFIRRTLDIRPGGRLVAWANEVPPQTQKLFFPYRTTPRSGTTCVKDSAGLVWRWMANDSLPDFMGEEALLYFYMSLSEITPNLEPGSDGLPGQGLPSLTLVFDVTDVGGAFVIDTTCIAHSNHLALLNDRIEEAPTTFQRSIVLIGCNAECHGDPICDGVCNIADGIKLIDVALQGVPPVIDPDPRCPTESTDLNCDMMTNVVDVVKMMNVLYRMADSRSEFCRPCTDVQRTGDGKRDVMTPYFRHNGG